MFRMNSGYNLRNIADNELRYFPYNAICPETVHD